MAKLFLGLKMQCTTAARELGRRTCVKATAAAQRIAAPCAARLVWQRMCESELLGIEEEQTIFLGRI